MFDALKCPSCGAPLDDEAPKFCSHCGSALKSNDQKKGFSININTDKGNRSFNLSRGEAKRSATGKSRIDALALAIAALFIGGISLHRAYAGNISALVLSVIFVWTGIPFIIAVVDAITIFGMTDEQFFTKFCGDKPDKNTKDK